MRLLDWLSSLAVWQQKALFYGTVLPTLFVLIRLNIRTLRIQMAGTFIRRKSSEPS